jgi:hypothetical protein
MGCQGQNGRAMKPRLHRIPIPLQSVLYDEQTRAQFTHALWLDQDPGPRPAIEVCQQVLFNAPRWVDAAMSMRNRVVKRLGLKDLGELSAIDPDKPLASYRVGERLGIFTLLAVGDNEVVLGDNDKHLEVKVSVCKTTHAGRPGVAVSTVVHEHNLLGRLYMLLVGPAHRVIAPAVMARARFSA